MEAESSSSSAPSSSALVTGEARSIAREASWLLAGRAVIAIAGWTGTAIIARKLSPSAWGGYSFVFGLFGILGLVVDLQVGRIVLRQVLDAGDGASRVVGSYTAFRVLIGFAVMMLGIAFVVVGGYETPVIWATVIVGTSLVFMSPGWGLRVWFQARLRLRPVALAMMAGAIVQLAAVLIVALTAEPTLPQFAVPTVIAEALVLLWLAIALRSAGVVPHLRFDASEWWVWIKEAAPLALGFALVSIYLKLDMVLLSQLDTLDSVGLYGIGYKFSDLAIFIPVALLTPVLTVMVSVDSDHSVALRRHFRQAFVLLFVSALAITVLFALVARPLIELLYGERYGEASGAARLLVAGAGVAFFTHLCVTTLIALGRNRLYALAGLVGLVLNVGMNLALIPAFSYNGSAVATVLTEIAVLALLLLGLHRASRVVEIPWTVLWRSVVAAFGLVAAFLAITRVLPWWVGAVGGATVFVGALHGLGVDGPGGLRGLVRNARFGLDTNLDDPQAL